jgi:hypothetical protein
VQWRTCLRVGNSIKHLVAIHCRQLPGQGMLFLKVVRLFLRQTSRLNQWFGLSLFHIIQIENIYSKLANTFTIQQILESLSAITQSMNSTKCEAIAAAVAPIFKASMLTSDISQETMTMRPSKPNAEWLPNVSVI